MDERCRPWPGDGEGSVPCTKSGETNAAGPAPCATGVYTLQEHVVTYTLCPGNFLSTFDQSKTPVRLDSAACHSWSY